MDQTDIRLTDMATAARDYCDLIEGIELNDCTTCLERMARLLPRLHAAVSALPSYLPIPAVFTGADDLEERFEMFSRMRKALGSLDGYWLEYDRSQLDSDKSGSLADDFTDIYFDLKHGLEMLSANPKGFADAAASWKTSFRLHWGQHLVDAERQLYALLEQFRQPN
jgi:hypothetical protein